MAYPRFFPHKLIIGTHSGILIGEREGMYWYLMSHEYDTQQNHTWWHRSSKKPCQRKFGMVPACLGRWRCGFHLENTILTTPEIFLKWQKVGIFIRGKYTLRILTVIWWLNEQNVSARWFSDQGKDIWDDVYFTFDSIPQFVRHFTCFLNSWWHLPYSVMLGGQDISSTRHGHAKYWTKFILKTVCKW